MEPMTVAELRKQLDRVEDDCHVCINDEPLVEVEIIVASGRQVVMLWDEDHCE